MFRWWLLIADYLHCCKPYIQKSTRPGTNLLYLGKENSLVWHGRWGGHCSLWFTYCDLQCARRWDVVGHLHSNLILHLGGRWGLLIALSSSMWWRGIPRLTAQSLALLHPSGQGWLPSCTSLPAPHWLWLPSLIASTTHSQNASHSFPAHIFFPLDFMFKWSQTRNAV